MEKYIDLHMHSKYSDDGEFTPTQLVEQCHKAGIKVMAIADHNSVKAIDEAKEAAAKLNIKYILNWVKTENNPYILIKTN